MAGIAGIIQVGDPPERDALLRLSAALAHRGSAAEQIFAEGGALLAQRNRRAGLELASSARLALVLDGRVARADTSAAPSADGGRLLAAWEQSGVESLSTLEGSFAFAIWERREQVLWLGRDPFGTRPLFWTRRGRTIAFASEIPALLTLPWVGRDLASENLAEYLSFRYVHAPRTLLRDVFEVPPGHVVRFDANGPRARRWWTPAWSLPEASVPPDRETSARVDEALRRAVGRLSADGPVGVLLSGGLDSSAILFHARGAPRPPVAFTVSLASDPADESPFAGRVARVLGVEQHVVRVEGARIVAELDACTARMGQPLPTAAAVLQDLLYREAAGHVRALLSGDGGDEVLGGRSIEQIAARVRAARALSRLPPGVRALGRVAAERAGRADLAGGAEHYGLLQSLGGSSVFDRDARQALLADAGLVRPGQRRALLEPLYREVQTDPLNEVLHVWQRGWLPEDSLARSDRLAAHAGLEVRYPLLDRELVQLCAGLPGEAKVRARLLGSGTKWPLRRAMEGRLPENLLNRPKRALPAPLDHWLRTEGVGFLRERTEALVGDPLGLFRPEEVRRLVRDHLAGAGNHGLKLWTLILFDAWRQTLR